MSTRGRSLVGVLLLAMLFAGGLGLLHTGIYGLTLFAVFPLIIGALASWIFRAKTSREALKIGAYSVAVASLLLLAIGAEGAICIVMVLPLATPLGALGGWLAYRSEIFDTGHARWGRDDALADARHLHLRHSCAATRIRGAKRNHNSCSSRTGLETRGSIPRHARAARVVLPRRGGVSAKSPHRRRWCWLHPILRLLHRIVCRTDRGLERAEPAAIPRHTQSPPPMREWSPYARLSPRHLHGYLISKQGQFKLTRLAGNRTLLEGTSWYQHGLWPAEYWRWWSDAIIHRIHMRVLNHIRMLSEQDAQ